MPDTKGQPTDRNGVAIERRRPGRRDINPALIPLLRRPVGDGMLPEDDAAWHLQTIPALKPGQDAIAAARGVAMGLILSAPLWGALAMVSAALRR